MKTALIIMLLVILFAWNVILTTEMSWTEVSSTKPEESYGLEQKVEEMEESLVELKKDIWTLKTDIKVLRGQGTWVR